MRAWLRRVARTPARERLVLRGSLLTSTWCEGRLAVDVDHVALLDPSRGLPPKQIDEARAIVAEVLAEPDALAFEDVTTEVIWAETRWPGLRVKAQVEGAPLQVDVGWGDPLAVAPAPIVIDGLELMAVRPETMVGWKVHGLFEFGHGRWRAKDLFDLFLLRTLPLDADALVASIRLAFASRDLPLSAADRFVAGPWGRSRGSRRRWESLSRKCRVSPYPLPAYDVVLEAVRVWVTPLLEAAKHP